MNKLAAIVLKHKALKYGIPEGQGWMTRQQVARQLGKPERDVHDLLRDAIEAKDIACQKFSEWDTATMRPVTVTCYRIIESGASKISKPSKTAKSSRQTDELTKSILSAAARHPEMLPGRLREYLPKRLRQLTTAKQVAAILANSR